MWLCLRFALLPLESLWLEDNDRAIAVNESQRIVCCNQAAQAYGIQSGQKLSTAYVLCDQLTVIERNVEREKQTLKHLALSAYPFSPVLSLWPNDKILIEIGRSLSMFGGIRNLLSRMHHVFQQENITFTMAVAPTPKAAELFSYFKLSESLNLWNEEASSFDEVLFLRSLYALPVEQLNLPDKTQQKIVALGFKKIGQLFELNEGAIAKRLGNDTLRYLQQIVGKVPDVQTCFQPTIVFQKKLEFLDVIHYVKALLFPMRRLLEEMLHFLRIYQKSCQSITWIIYDTYGKTIEFEVNLIESQIDASAYLELTQLKLESITLTGPVESLQLNVNKLSDLTIKESSLFAQIETFNENLDFANKIRARLGDDSCVWLSEKNTLIPELAQNTKQQVEEVLSDYHAITVRPTWLLPEPQFIGKEPSTLYWDGKLNVISQPERIVHHWWKKKVERDYYVAQHQSGVFYWVFYDQLKQSWFLQGIFA